tara:strand:+ start:34304 stop:35698 length:1395 start_codon:yes stop_codon:yes gene_type:complete
MSKNRKYLNNLRKKITLSLVMIVALLVTKEVSAQGEDLFKKNCAVCHRASTKDATGPGLAGVSENRSADWIYKWVTASQDLIASGDADALAVFEKFNKIPMPPYPNLTEEEVASIFTFVDETVAATAESGAGTGDIETATTDAVVVKPMSSSQKYFVYGACIFLILLVLYVRKFLKRIEQMKIENGVHDAPFAIKNYPLLFLVYVAIAGLIIYILNTLITGNVGSTTTLLFGAFPYVAFAIFIIGSIYRYKKRGYKVSSLSTQFLEGKKLFYGSQPFHWGLLVLFFGHLIAFLFPSAVLAWNGQPVRLLILEISSFAFALSALLGLVLLIYRRLTTKTLLLVTNKMDMVVYTILLTQIVSGLAVAYFVRWGSTWFATALTPYLKSIFHFNPDLDVISIAPFWIQIHVISAFLLIAIIPFTRFMHFLVAPIDYAWRNYQQVTWNWNRKSIRNSTKHFYGKKPRNH